MQLRIKRWIGIAAYALIMPTALFAQGDKPVTITVGFAPGAGTDILARALAEKLGTRLGRTVIVENKPGASGMLAVSHVAKATPDGNTLLFVPNTLVITSHLLTDGVPKVDVINDLVPVTQVTKSTLLLVVNAKLGAKNARELTAMARKSPGMTFGTAGNGTPQHIGGELFKRAANVQLTHVPYKGSAPALTDLMGGHLDMAITSLAAAKPFLSDGRLVPIGIIQKERSPLLPQVPTMTEQGIRGVELSGWFGVLAPKGTPDAVVAKLNREMNAVLAMPEIQSAFVPQGEVPVGGSHNAFADLVRTEYKFYGRVIREFNIKAE